jgi:hypothetical protein
MTLVVDSRPAEAQTVDGNGNRGLEIFKFPIRDMI